MVGICGSGTSPIIIPTRSKGEPIMGNNPLAIEAPAVNDGESFMLDMAMSTVAFGKVEIQKMKGQDLPSNRWSVDPQGCPTTDPVAGSQPGAALQPLGGSEIDASHKGYGLSVAMELLCEIMSGSSCAYQKPHWYERNRSRDHGQFFVVVNPDHFAPGLSKRLQELMDHLRSQPPIDPANPVLVPGDPERLAMAQVRQANGTITYTKDHILKFRSLAKRLGVEAMKAL